MNLLAELKEIFTEEIVTKIATLVNENEQKTQKAIDSLLCTVVGGLIKRSTNESGATTLINVISKGNYNDEVIHQLKSTLQSKEAFLDFTTKGNSLVSMLLPDKKSSIANIISEHSSIRNSSATSILALVMPVILSKLGGEINRSGLNKEGIANFLYQQRDSLINETAEEFRFKMVDTIGLSSILSQDAKIITYPTATPAKTTSFTNRVVEPESKKPEVKYSVKDYSENTSEPKSFPKWILPTVLSLAVVGVGGYFAYNYDWSNLTKTNYVEVADTIQTKIDSSVTKIDSSAIANADTTTAATSESAAPKEVSLSLPDGESIDVTEGTFNYNFVKYLQDSTSKPLKTIIMDNLNFEMNTSNLIEGSQKTVDDFTKIMKAYKRLQVKLIGYTDNSGDTLVNKKLSMKRAVEVRSLLVLNGIDRNRIDMDGKGPFNPIAPNDTEEGKQKNRRIEVKVIKK
ncbi:MAG: OmpA family protein [Pseudarcicella sp.]|nr:OmpA family protein [Pseudarcicella sp.]